MLTFQSVFPGPVSNLLCADHGVASLDLVPLLLVGAVQQLLNRYLEWIQNLIFQTVEPTPNLNLMAQEQENEKIMT